VALIFNWADYAFFPPVFLHTHAHTDIDEIISLKYLSIPYVMPLVCNQKIHELKEFYHNKYRFWKNSIGELVVAL
jgi:hypothetical protein